MAGLDVERTSAEEIARLLDARELTCEEVAQAYLDRIAAFDESLHVFLHVDSERVLGAPAAPADALAMAVERQAWDENPVDPFGLDNRATLSGLGDAHAGGDEVGIRVIDLEQVERAPGTVDARADECFAPFAREAEHGPGVELLGER